VRNYLLAGLLIGAGIVLAATQSSAMKTARRQTGGKKIKLRPSDRRGVVLH
jgi:hypothetical protein